MNALKRGALRSTSSCLEESRLGREQLDETAYALKQIIHAVRARLFLPRGTGSARSTTPMDKVMLYPRQLLRRAGGRRPAATQLARSLGRRPAPGTGGRVYGYDNVEVLGDGRRTLARGPPHHGAKPPSCRRIFAFTVEGLGITKIAKALNEDGVTPPARASGWAPTAVREILRAALPWRDRLNRIQKRDQWGIKRYLDRAEGEWLRVEASDLAYRLEDLWQAAHRRIDTTRALYATGGRATDRPDQEKYLLSGLATCATCAARWSPSPATTSARASAAGSTAATTTTSAGPKVCANRLLIRQERLDRVVLDAIAERSTSGSLDRAMQKASSASGGRQTKRTIAGRHPGRASAPGGPHADRRGRDRARLRHGHPPGRAEGRRATQARLVAELEAWTGRRQDAASLDVERLHRELVRHAAEVRTLLGQDIPRRGRSSCGCWWGGWSARPSRRASAAATASKPAARTRRYCPRRWPHLTW
jgi:hypothetical protein